MVIMNKKIFLALLPTFLVLTSCGGLNQKSPVDRIKEDNLAHEELFGKLNPRRVDPEPASEWNLAPKVGVQHATYEIEEQTYYAVRYVAAISGLEDGVTASWTRAVSGKDATIVKAQSDGHLSTVTYDTLNNNGTPMNATDEGSGYTKYIVYTIYDIPESQKDSFMMAYLTLSKEAEEPVVSKAIATRLAGTYSFSFDNGTRGYFLGGNFNNTSGVITPNAEADEHSYAIFQNLDIRRTDYFGVFNYTGEEFKYYGFSSFYANSHTHFMNDNEIAKPKYRGEYLIKVSKDEETKNQVLVTRNTLRLDNSTTNYNGGNRLTFKKGCDAEIRVYRCDEVSGNLINMMGDLNSYFELDALHDHIFNIKTFTIKFAATIPTYDNNLKLIPTFYYNPTLDGNIYGNKSTYANYSGWGTHVLPMEDGTYTYTFGTISVAYVDVGRMDVYPNSFRLLSEHVENGNNARFNIEYIELTFANEGV